MYPDLGKGMFRGVAFTELACATLRMVKGNGQFVSP